MKTHPLLFVPLTAMLLAFPAVAASATPLVLHNVSAARAAARLSANYGINIVLKANSGLHLNVALDDADDAGARLQTVNALANALRLDFTKTIVVSKGTSGVSDPAAVDSETSIPFGRTTMPTREAIALIAGVDAAFAKISGDIGGVVTFSRPTLSASQAEDEVAKQTGTTWKAVYVLAPRSLVAFTQSSLLFFPDRQREAQERRAEEEAERQAAQEQAFAYQAYQQAASRQQASPQRSSQNMILDNQGMNGQSMNGNGYYPNGYGAYGNPYTNSGYGNSGYYSDANGFGNGVNTIGNAGGNFPNHVVGGGQ